MVGLRNATRTQRLGPKTRMKNPADKQAKDEWIRRVLGVDVSTGSSLVDTGDDIVGLWWNAKDTINEQLEGLRHAILATEHPLAARACENGLGGFSGGVLVRFQASVIECGNAAPEAAKRAWQNIERDGAALTAFISSDPILSLLEKNPFGIHVTIREDVTRAVEAILKQAKA
jgi:hypothetical protein